MRHVLGFAFVAVACHSKPPPVTPPPRPLPPPPVVACTAVGAPVVGQTCRTAAGKVFAWVADPVLGNVWKSPDNIVWTRELGPRNLADATALCKGMNAELPAVADYDRNDQGGMFELFPDLPKVHNSSVKQDSFWPGWPLGGDRCDKFKGTMFTCPESLYRVHCARHLGVTLPACKGSDNHEVGYRCATEVNSIFERVDRRGFGAAVRGPDGLIWSAVLANEAATQPDAVALCAKLGARLATDVELQRGSSDYVRSAVTPFPGADGLGKWWGAQISNGNGEFLQAQASWTDTNSDPLTARHSVVCIADEKGSP